MRQIFISREACQIAARLSRLRIHSTCVHEASLKQCTRNRASGFSNSATKAAQAVPLRAMLPSLPIPGQNQPELGAANVRLAFRAIGTAVPRFSSNAHPVELFRVTTPVPIPVPDPGPLPGPGTVIG